MKRKSFSIIVIGLLLALSGCGNKSEDMKNNQAPSEPESASSQAEESQTGADTALNTKNEPAIESKDFYADVNHDGKEDKIVITVDSTDTTMPTLVTATVFSEETEIFQSEIPTTAALAYQYYITEWEGKDYLLYYYPILDHDMAICKFEVFSLNENGEKETLDSGEIEASLVTPAELDKDAWIAFAEKENKYFETAYLLADTTNFKIECGDPEQKKGYTETFSWINAGKNVPYDSAEENLQYFMDQKSDYDT